MGLDLYKVICLFQDKYGNHAGLDLTGKVHMEVLQADDNLTYEIPKLVGNSSSKQQVAFSRGSAVIQVCRLVYMSLYSETCIKGTF